MYNIKKRHIFRAAIVQTLIQSKRLLSKRGPAGKLKFLCNVGLIKDSLGFLKMATKLTLNTGFNDMSMTLIITY